MPEGVDGPAQLVGSRGVLLLQRPPAPVFSVSVSITTSGGLFSYSRGWEAVRLPRGGEESLVLMGWVLGLG